MPAYHSIFLEEPNQQLIGNFALLPLRTRTRGPAQQLPALPAEISELDVDPSSESYDPLDEVLSSSAPTPSSATSRSRVLPTVC